MNSKVLYMINVESIDLTCLLVYIVQDSLARSTSCGATGTPWPGALQVWFDLVIVECTSLDCKCNVFVRINIVLMKRNLC